MRHIMTLALMLIFFSADANDAKACEILDKATSMYQSQKSITARFLITEQDNTINGTITVSGDRFKLSSPAVSMWYDGRTLWAYSPSTSEVNITEPTVEELQQVNPFAIISAFSQNFHASIIKSSNQSHSIQFTPVSGSNTVITKAVVKINATTLYPTDIVLTTDNNTTTTIKVNHVKSGGALPVSDFMFNEADYPNAEIVDLR